MSQTHFVLAPRRGILLRAKMKNTRVQLRLQITPQSRSVRRCLVRAAAVETKPLKTAKGSERSVVILPGLGNSSADYGRLQADLEEKGFAVESCFVRRADWLRNAAGITDGNYWRGTLNPRPTVDWYLNRIDDAVETVKQRTDGAPITLLAHSAGGWLGRLYMKDFGTTGIDNFVTLGSPHSPPPKDKPGVFDQTRGILHYCEQEIPGTFHSDVRYVTVAGKFVKGCKWNESGPFSAKFAGAVYKQVCGEADVWGDGVVPNVSSHLDGALTLELSDVYHSPVGSTADTADDREAARPWYGSKGTLELWLDHLAPTQVAATHEA